MLFSKPLVGRQEATVGRVVVKAISLFGAVLVLGLPAHAGEPVRELDMKTEWAVNAVLISGWVLPESFKSSLAPESCRWCDVDDTGKWAPPTWDGWARETLGGHGGTAATTSDVFAFAVLPLAAVGVDLLANDGDWHAFGDDMTLVTQAVAASALVNQVVKYSAGRARPYTHFSPRTFDEDHDQNLSFYSGHTSLAFSMVVATGLALQRRDSPYAPWVFGVGLPVATGVGLLRIMADKHYLTDVTVGAIMGSAIPYLLISVVHGD